MGLKRIVDIDLWSDAKVVENFTPDDKFFLLYILTNPKSSLLGVYSLSPKQIAYDMGYSYEAVINLINRFDKEYDIIKYCFETSEIAIKNYLKYGIVKGGKPIEDCLVRDIKKTKNKMLLQYVYENISGVEDVNETVKKIIPLLNTNINENGNGKWSMDNGCIVPRIVDVSYHESSKPIRHKYGEYQNVLLSDEELEKLKDEFPDWEERIERLSSYIASTGKKYKNFLATIRNWAKNEKPKQAAKNDPYDLSWIDEVAKRSEL